MIRIIGDSHGNNSKFPRRPLESHCHDRNYLKLIDGVDYSICLGDIGWRENLECFKGIDHTRHKVLYGNHSDWTAQLPHHLGRYGFNKLGDLSFFFIDGAFSIDWMYRASSGPNKTWWDNEELSYQEMCDCLELYTQIKPDVVLAHDCPHFLCNYGVVKSQFKVDNPSKTAKFLEHIYSAWEPKYFFHGHWHMNYRKLVGKTEFIGISELCYVDYDGDFRGPF